jgi:hypothetical protein
LQSHAHNDIQRASQSTNLAPTTTLGTAATGAAVLGASPGCTTPCGSSIAPHKAVELGNDRLFRKCRSQCTISSPESGQHSCSAQGAATSWSRQGVCPAQRQHVERRTTSSKHAQHQKWRVCSRLAAPCHISRPCSKFAERHGSAMNAGAQRHGSLQKEIIDRIKTRCSTSASSCTAELAHNPLT